MDPSLLRAFLETADAGAMSRAAERLGLSQPSLTLQIQRLEKHLGVALFRRHGRGVALTDAGQALYPRARRILDEMRAARPSRRSTSPAAVRHYREGHARRLEIREDYSADLERQLLDGALDVVIAAQPFPFDRVDIEVLGTEALLVAVPAGHPAARAGRITLAQLRDEPAVTLDAAHCLGEQVADFCSSRQVLPSVVCRSAQLATVLELVGAGVGVSIVPAMAATRDAPLGCAFVPLADQSLTRDIVAAWRPRRVRSPAARAFVDGVREVLRG